MHKSQLEGLYMQMSEQQKKHTQQIDGYKSQLIYLEKKNEEQVREIKTIYQGHQSNELKELQAKLSQMENYTKHVELKNVDLQKVMSNEIKAKYDAELIQMQQMNQDLVRKHVRQIDTLYQEKSGIQIEHASEVKRLKDQIEYLEGKYSMLKHFEQKMAHYEIPETKIIYKYDESL